MGARAERFGHPGNRINRRLTSGSRYRVSRMVKALCSVSISPYSDKWVIGYYSVRPRGQLASAYGAVSRCPLGCSPLDQTTDD